MKRITALVIVLLIVIPYHTDANEKSDEQKRVDAINQAIQSTVKIVPRTNEYMGVELDPQHGSGLFYAPNTIVTNWHVVKEATNGLYVYKSDGTKCNGKVGYRDEEKDLAIVTLDCTGVPLTVAKAAVVGQDVFAIGSANIDFAVTQGIVASLDDMGFIVVDAHINHGNSGGAIINSDGEVIGVVKGMLKLDPAFTYGIQIDDLTSFLRRAGY